MVTILQDAQLVLMILEELEIGLRLISDSLGRDLAEVRRDHQRTMRLKAPFTDANLARMILELRNEVVVDERVAEGLKLMRGHQEDTDALRGVPTVEIRVRTHAPNSFSTSSSDRSLTRQVSPSKCWGMDVARSRAMTFMPAATPAATPTVESSITTQASGFTPRS